MSFLWLLAQVLAQLSALLYHSGRGCWPSGTYGFCLLDSIGFGLLGRKESCWVTQKLGGGCGTTGEHPIQPLLEQVAQCCVQSSFECSRMETPQLFWATCPSVLLPFLPLNRVFCMTMGVLSWGTAEKGLALSPSLPSIRCIHRWMRGP